MANSRLAKTVFDRLRSIGIAPHVVELCLNHKLAGVAGTYNKFKYEKEMAAAWEKWSAHISETALKVRKA